MDVLVCHHLIGTVVHQLFFFHSKPPNAEMKLMAPIRQHAKQTLCAMKNLSAIPHQGIQFTKQRPFTALFLGTFLATSFLPLMTYLFFTCAVGCIGLFLLVVIEGLIIAMATVTLLAFLIVPACIASGLSVFAYTVYVALSQMKFIVTSAVNDPQKRFKLKSLEKKWDDKPSFKGNARVRCTRKNSDISGDDSDNQDLDVKRENVDSLSQSQHKKAFVFLHQQCVEESDRVCA